jgi:D-glycero-alpha-D-manno-heptose-7-phosphate kinase
MLIVRSPVRISFGGGGTDLPAYYENHGGTILSTTINKYVYTIVSKREDEKIQIISADLHAMEHWDDLAKMPIRGKKLELPLAVLKTLGQHVSVNLFLASEIPPGTGLGSSATVCVNLLKALTTYVRMPASKYEIAEKAFDIARNVLEKPVGKQDEYAASFGGLNFITIARDGITRVEPLNIPAGVKRELQQNLMLFFTGTAHDSWTILREQEKSSAHEGVETLHEMRCLAECMRDALLAGNLDRFGTLLDEGWQAKKKLSRRISNAAIDDLYAIGRKHGAVGGKIAGAGGGGFLILYCEQKKQAAIRESFAQRDLRELKFEFESEGAQVIVNDPFLDGDTNCGLRWHFSLNAA